MGNQKFHVRNLVTDGLNIICWDVGHGVYVDPYWRDVCYYYYLFTFIYIYFFYF